MFLDDFHTFLLKHSGMTGKIIDYVITNDASEPPFSTTYQSNTDPLLRTLSIVTAPVCLTILAAEFFLGAIVIAFKSLFELVKDGPETAKQSAKMACGCLLMIAVSLFAAFVSPVINAADLIGGGVNTLLEQCGDEEYSFCC
jgi:hypothetical protein